MQNIEEILAAAGIDGEVAAGIAKSVGENYRTIAEVEQKAKKVDSLAAKLKETEDALTAAKEAAASEDVEGLKKKLAEYEEAAKAKAAKEAEDAKRAAFSDTFEKALGERKFANKLVADTVKEKAYQTASANPDMKIGDIVDGIVGDGAGIWENPQQAPHKMPQGGSQGGHGGAITSLDQVKGMSADEINRNWDSIKQLLKK